MRWNDVDAFTPILLPVGHGSTIRIRPLEAVDGALLGRLYEQVGKGASCIMMEHEPCRAEALRDAGDALSPYAVCLVALDDASDVRACAWCRWRSETSQTGGFGLCSRDDVCGTGVVEALVEALIEEAAGKAPPVLRLRVPKAQRAVVALCQQLGFEAVSEGISDLGRSTAEPQVWMERPLA